MSRWLKKNVTTADARAALPPAPPARRPRRTRVLDPRLWLGVLLIAVSVLAGARILNSQDEGVLVLRATRDLAVGAAPTALTLVRVSRAVAGGGYLVEAPPEGAMLRWPISAGELVPSSAIAVSPVGQVREVSVPVDPLHAPPGLMAGDLVDLWSSPRESDDAHPVLVRSGLSVAAVASDEIGMGGEIGVVLLVPSEHVADVVAASRSGAVDLVAVPIESQTAIEGR